MPDAMQTYKHIPNDQKRNTNNDPAIISTLLGCGRYMKILPSIATIDLIRLPP